MNGKSRKELINLVNGNEVLIIGKIAEHPEYNHKHRDTSYYKFVLKVNRLSGYSDMINCVAYAGFCDGLEVGHKVIIKGKLQSKTTNGTLITYVQVKDIEHVASNEEYVNSCVIDGYICDTPTYNQGKNNKKISCFMLATNNKNVAHYIPCVAWNEYAEWIKFSETGTHVKINGRIQSRDFIKDGKDKRINELSIQKLEIIEEDNNYENDFAENNNA